MRAKAITERRRKERRLPPPPPADLERYRINRNEYGGPQATLHAVDATAARLAVRRALSQFVAVHPGLSYDDARRIMVDELECVG